MHLIGLDVGTTGCKAAVFDPAGRMLGYGFAEYGMVCDEPAKAEQDAEEVWQATRRVLAKAVAESGVKDIRAICVSVQGDAVIPVTPDWKPLHPALLGMDYRSEPQARACSERLGARLIFNRTGMRPHALTSLAKMLWLRENRPEVFARAWKIVTYADFILGKLGAPPVIDWTMASRTMALDLRSGAWSTEILQAFDLSSELLSRPAPSGTVVGVVAARVAEAAGLPRDVQLVAGGHDQTCAALGAGIVHSGTAVISTGTAEVLSAALERPALNDAMFDHFYPCYRYVKPEMYFTFSLNHVGGLLLRWCRDNFAAEEVREAARDGRDPYDVMIRKIPPRPTSVMVLPHFVGSGNPWFDKDSKGAILGLTVGATRHDIVRAVLESQTYELAVNMEALNRAGIEISELRAVGGGAKSSAWLQIKADILGRPVCTLEAREGACLGAAILAGVATGAYRSVDEGVESAVHTTEIFEPSPALRSAYRDRFELYRDIYPTLKNLNGRL